MKLPVELIFREPMPAKAFKLLVYLFSVSSAGGECSPGYAAMCAVMRDGLLESGSENTARRHLKTLKRLGWIFRITPTRPLRIYLQIPHRFRRAALPKSEPAPRPKIVRFP